MSSFWDRLKGELIDIVQFLDDSSNTLVYRFDRRNNEIKNNAKLVVREGQAAVFVNEGKLADVLGPGTYTLNTQNVPILSTLLGWKYGFESPFKAEVYFVSTRQFTDLKWGTQNPVIVRDPEFGPTRIRAFGTYTTRVSDPGRFIKELVGTEGRVTTDEVINQLRNFIVSHFADLVGESKIPLLDMSGKQDELAGFIKGRIATKFGEYGLELPTLLIENISLPPEVEAALDKRTSMGVVGDLNAYSKFQAAEAMRDAAKNPGAAGSVIGLGMGQVLGGMMAQGAVGPAPAASTPPPPLPASAPYFLGINGQQQGPFEPALLRQKAAAGELTPDTLVWKQGMPAWTPAKDVPDLAAILGSAPPPLPPR
jgi:membrane protease subunit (stomatin/prohibitin family)